MTRHVRTPIPGVVVVLLLAGCHARSAPRELIPFPYATRADLPGGAVVVPMATARDLPLVDVTLNGAGPFAFVIDTGSGLSAISPQLAARITDGAWANIVGGDGGLVDPGRRRIRITRVLRDASARIGTATFRGFDVAVIDFTMIHEQLGEHVHGILSSNVFLEHLLTLDYPGQRVAIERGVLEPAPDVLSTWFGRDARDAAPNPDMPEVEVRLGDQPVRVFVDTGSGYELHLAPTSFALVEFASPPTTMPGGWGMAGPLQPETSGRASQSLFIGPHEIATPTVSSGAANVIGSRAMRHFRVTIDPSHNSIRFERPNAPATTQADGPASLPPPAAAP